MSEEINNPRYLSPCTATCKLSNKMCSSCLRTTDEIKKWRRLTVEDRMTILSQVRSQISTHSCPECSGPSYCAMEAGKSSNLCWCMTVDKPYTPDTNYGQCLCRRCLTKETNGENKQ